MPLVGLRLETFDPDEAAHFFHLPFLKWKHLPFISFSVIECHALKARANQAFVFLGDKCKYHIDKNSPTSSTYLASDSENKNLEWIIQEYLMDPIIDKRIWIITILDKSMNFTSLSGSEAKIYVNNIKNIYDKILCNKSEK